MSFLRRFSFSSQKSSDNSVTLLFNLEAKDQDKLEEINRNFSHRDAELFAQELVKDMTWDRFNERVLDCGCGTGKTGFTHFLPQIYTHDSHLYSVDASESLISYASMKYPHASVSYARGDVLSENFPFKFITFDKIFALHVLQCIKEYGSALKKFFELLRPGGQLGLTFATHFYWDQLDSKFSTNKTWKEYFENFLDKSGSEEREIFQQKFQQQLEHFGYEVVKIKTEVLEYTFPSLEKAVVYYIATSPYVRSIPAELQEPFEQDCLNGMMQDYKLNDISDEFKMTYNCVYVVAKKPGYPQKVKVVNKHKRTRNRLSLP